jgi:hypothetical protein
MELEGHAEAAQAEQDVQEENVSVIEGAQDLNADQTDAERLAENA